MTCDWELDMKAQKNHLRLLITGGKSNSLPLFTKYLNFYKMYKTRQIASKQLVRIFISLSPSSHSHPVPLAS